MCLCQCLRSSGEKQALSNKLINKKISMIVTVTEIKQSHMVDMDDYLRFTQEVILKKTETLMTRRSQPYENPGEQCFRQRNTLC